MGRGIGSACYAALVLLLGQLTERYAPTLVVPVFAGLFAICLLYTSIRCTPQIHGASRDAIGYVWDAVSREINAVTDNPLIFPEAVSYTHLNLSPLNGKSIHLIPLFVPLKHLRVKKCA